MSNKDQRDPQADRIAMNLLPLEPQDFRFTVYRAKCPSVTGAPTKLPEGVGRYPLPDSPGNAADEYARFNVSLVARDGFVEFECGSFTNWRLTCWYLFERIRSKSQEALAPDAFFADRDFGRNIAFVLDHGRLGHETVELSPYFLKSAHVLGFLVGYHFRPARGVPFDRRVQQKSLSLDQNFKENKDFYADHYRKIQQFLTTYRDRIFPLALPDGNTLGVAAELEVLGSDRLKVKKYVFSGGNSATSQFMGVKSNGPLSPVADDSLICFMYRPEDKPLSHDLYRALRGDTYGTFRGMDAMFRFSLGREHVIGVPLTGFERNDLEDAIHRLRSQAGQRTALPLILFPWSRMDTDPEGRRFYYSLKHCFLSHRLPTQLVSLRCLRDRASMKWSIANIGLGVFSKLGGTPWKVQPEHEKCLIIGIGQCHRRQEDGTINRYYAYSVLTDSSGIYDTIRTLADVDDETAYLNGLTTSLREVLHEYAQSYERFVIHTTFKLRRKEMAAIHTALEQYEQEVEVPHRLVALKFNDRNRFFGFATWNNSRVPYESSLVTLSERERLIWFEGLQYHNTTIRGRIGRPMHVQLAYPTDRMEEQELTKYLQDALNLSGANWRGFNAKSMPVSVYYAGLIARYVGHFDQLGLGDVDFDGMAPWFL